MKKLYTVIFILLSVVLLPIFLSYFFIKTEEHTLEPFKAQDTQNPIETDDGVCLNDDSAALLSGNISNSNQKGWELIWQDEFENHCLDFTIWQTENWAAEKNNELQYYSPDNVKVEKGVLKLLSKKELYKGRMYTSGAVHTKGKFNFLYGKAEMRAKLPAGQGMYPAFWLVTDQKDQWLPEINIMEMLGHEPTEIWMVLHWLGEDGTLKSDSSSFIGPDFSKDFHTYSIEWTPDSITWLIDDIERFKTNINIPKEKMYLYLNTAVGGDWPGSPDHTTVFPVSYEIDYVRVFKSRKE